MDQITKAEVIQFSSQTVADAIFDNRNVMSVQDVVRKIGEINKNLAELLPDIHKNNDLRVEFRQHLGLLHKNLIGRNAKQEKQDQSITQQGTQQMSLIEKIGNPVAQSFDEKAEEVSMLVKNVSQQQAEIVKQEQAKLVSAQQQDSFKPLIPESLTPTKTPQQSIIVKPAENKTFGQKALNILDLAGDVYTAYKISSWGCGILADLLGLDKYALSGIDYVLDMGKNYLTNLLNAPKQVKELTAVVEQTTAQNKKLEAVVEEVTTQKEELKSQFDETVGKLQEETTQKEELKAVVEEVKAEKEDLQIQLAEKAKDFTKCTAEVCKITKEKNWALSAALLVVFAFFVTLIAKARNA